MDVAALIPAYRPTEALLALVRTLERSELAAIIVVDDGSGPEYAPLFQRVRLCTKVRLLRHAVNLGKGAALRTGMNFALCEMPGLHGVVTADADGQHHPEDILRVASALAAQSGRLVLGARLFEGKIPFRSRLGNSVTRFAFRYLVGQKLRDTQTGLRGIPRALMPELLKINSRGYEFELDMLITAKHHGWRITEEPIRTIYEPGNPSSHFNPLLDSVKAYAVLLRFSGVSLMTAILDNLVFYLAYSQIGSIALSQTAARSAAIVFQYTASRNAVFFSRQPHRSVFPKFLLAVVVQGSISYAMIRGLVGPAHMSLIFAKPLAEGILFALSFLVQRDFIFSKPAPDAPPEPTAGSERVIDS